MILERKKDEDMICTDSMRSRLSVTVSPALERRFTIIQLGNLLHNGSEESSLRMKLVHPANRDLRIGEGTKEARKYYKHRWC